MRKIGGNREKDETKMGKAERGMRRINREKKERGTIKQGEKD